MTDFLATLALRGAGLSPADGRGALAPRPRAVFEPEGFGPAAGGMLVEHADEIAAPPPEAAVAPQPPPARPRAEVSGAERNHPESPPRSAANPPASWPDVPAAIEPAVRRAPALASPAPARARASRGAAVTRTAAPPPPARTPEAPPRSETRAIDAAPQAPQAVVEERTTVEIPRPPAADAAAPPHPARAVPPPRPLEGATEPRPPVTVSIGRIDVEVAPPPRPPARRSAPERTRGFDHYARARRGRPRS